MSILQGMCRLAAGFFVQNSDESQDFAMIFFCADCINMILYISLQSGLCARLYSQFFTDTGAVFTVSSSIQLR